MGNGQRSPRRETLERCAVALWLATIVVLLFATLGTRLAGAAELRLFSHQESVESHAGELFDGGGP